MEWLKRNLSPLWLSIVTFIYSLSMIFQDTYIRIIEPPARYVLIGIMVILAALLLFSIIFRFQKLEGWVVVFLAVFWAFIAWFYFVHPVNNSKWVLAVSIVGFSFISLYRGDFD